MRIRIKPFLMLDANTFLTSIMPPSCFFTSFWKLPPSKFSFPLAEPRNVVTTVLMADSISKERETRRTSGGLSGGRGRKPCGHISGTHTLCRWVQFVLSTWKYRVVKCVKMKKNPKWKYTIKTTSSYNKQTCQNCHLGEGQCNSLVSYGACVWITYAIKWYV